VHAIFLLEILKGKYHSEDLGVDVNIIGECLLGKECANLCTRYMWLMIGFCEYCNEYFGFIKGGK
jgi:hypothetical protein